MKPSPMCRLTALPMGSLQCSMALGASAWTWQADLVPSNGSCRVPDSRAPWLVVAFAAGIAAWFALPSAGWWAALMVGGLTVAGGAVIALREDGRFPFLRQAVVALALALAFGCGHVWMKSSLVGAAPILRPQAAELSGTILSARSNRQKVGFGC